MGRHEACVLAIVRIAKAIDWAIGHCPVHIFGAFRGGARKYHAAKRHELVIDGARQNRLVWDDPKGIVMKGQCMRRHKVVGVAEASG